MGASTNSSFSPVGIKRIIPHPDFEIIVIPKNLTDAPPNNAKWAQDIAVIELDSKLEWSELLQPACLPQPQQTDELYKDGRMAMAAGEGGREGGKKVAEIHFYEVYLSG